MNIERRLRKLESSDPNRYWGSVVSLIVEEDESNEEVIRRHFGEEGPSIDLRGQHVCSNILLTGAEYPAAVEWLI